jgi:hypothetical protein
MELNFGVLDPELSPQEAGRYIGAATKDQPFIKLKGLGLERRNGEDNRRYLAHLAAAIGEHATFAHVSDSDMGHEFHTEQAHSWDPPGRILYIATEVPPGGAGMSLLSATALNVTLRKSQPGSVIYGGQALLGKPYNFSNGTTGCYAKILGRVEPHRGASRVRFDSRTIRDTAEDNVQKILTIFNQIAYTAAREVRLETDQALIINNLTMLHRLRPSLNSEAQSFLRINLSKLDWTT